MTDETTLLQLENELAAVRLARHEFITGGNVQQAWSGRFGNRMNYDNPSLDDYNNMIRMLEVDISECKAAMQGQPIRKAIRLTWA